MCQCDGAEQLWDLRLRLDSVLVGRGETCTSADSGDVQPASVIVYNPGVQTSATDTGLLKETASWLINVFVQLYCINYMHILTFLIYWALSHLMLIGWERSFVMLWLRTMPINHYCEKLCNNTLFLKKILWTCDILWKFFFFLNIYNVYINLKKKKLSGC